MAGAVMKMMAAAAKGMRQFPFAADQRDKNAQAVSAPAMKLMNSEGPISGRLTCTCTRAGRGAHVEFADGVSLLPIGKGLFEFRDDPLDGGAVVAVALRFRVDLGNVVSDVLALFHQALDALDDGDKLVGNDVVAHAAAPSCCAGPNTSGRSS